MVRDAEQCKASCDGSKPEPLRGNVLLAFDVRRPHDSGEAPQHRIGYVVVLQNRFECAPIPTMIQCYLGKTIRVERCRIMAFCLRRCIAKNRILR